MANVEYINPFITASKRVMKDFCNIDTEMGKPYLTKTVFEGNKFVILVGITGQLTGQVILSMSNETACNIASHMMMGMPVTELNDMAASAISELANMILGNTATIFSTQGIIIDITPPSILVGKDMTITVSDAKTICVPLTYAGDYALELNIAIKSKE
ncbi:MAG: chemotaxis protein CheX [Firmicutes bacterium HGW-Firmicutes-3]|jgi:chemotaxis protein CheX|nr:MAG: chemotaxis protein CheX [Firmicutes bacterium HGW-Firmicutes-3]